MDIDKLEGNSHKLKGETAKLPKYDVAVKSKKANKVTKFAKSVIAEDAKSVASYILMDVLRPALQKLIVDIVQNGISALVYGQGTPAKSRSSTQKVSYSGMYSSNLYGRTRASELRNRPVYDMDDLIFEPADGKSAYEQAYEFLVDARDYLSRDRDSVLSVGDVRSSLGLSTTSTDWDYGWSDLGKAEVLRRTDGTATIDFPKLEALK